MTVHTSGFAALAVTLVLSAALASQTAAQDSRRLTLEEARRYAVQLLRVQEAAAAREIALGLLQADPDDATALILLSQAERLLENADAAADAGRHAWRVAETPTERFNAAMVTAQALTLAEKYTQAQIWLRRSSQIAPTPDAEALIARDYGILRSINPLAVRLSFGLTPSNNVNGGNSNQTITFAYLPGPFALIPWEVPQDDRPLSGLELSADVALRYRLSQSATSRLSLDGGVVFRTYFMSEEAQNSAPTVTGNSLSNGMAEVGLSYQAVPDPSGPSYSAQLQYTYAIYAMAPYSHALSLSLGSRWAGDGRNAVAVTGNMRYTYFITDEDTATSYELQTQWDHGLANNDIISTSLKLARTEADNSDRAYTGAAASLSYDFGSIMGRFDLSALYQEEFRVYDTSAYDPAGREDRQTVVQLRAGFPAVQLYGFEPVATLTARRTDSSVPYFDTEGVQIGLNFRSSF